MEEQKRIQLNVRVAQDTADKLDELTAYYQKHTKYGKVYKGDVLTDIIDKSYDIMEKQVSMEKRYQ
ncbi:hypothetical protein [Salibacterium halotolerans]|uniref:Uncharacterized protein n=1 Tax=Salibacterium halotolerans TaxID=1884432 RepID=A0A1I5QHF0_9BACI|nr:hypothetical protein [Salibacterium halotolerans]SFP45481.1 hypothetical protein SAMN05518683_105155 [Salibacterium halotolerans]